MEIHVRDVAGEEHPFEVTPTMTVEELRKEVSLQLDLEPSTVQLEVGGVTYTGGQGMVAFSELPVAMGDVIKLSLNRKAAALLQLANMGFTKPKPVEAVSAARAGNTDAAVAFLEAGIGYPSIAREALSAGHTETALATLKAGNTGSYNVMFLRYVLKHDQHAFLEDAMGLSETWHFGRTNMLLIISRDSEHFGSYCAAVGKHATEQHFHTALTHMVGRAEFNHRHVRGLLAGFPTVAVNLGSMAMAYERTDDTTTGLLMSHPGGLAQSEGLRTLKRIVRLTPERHLALTVKVIDNLNSTTLSQQVVTKLLETTAQHHELTSLARHLVGMGGDVGRALPFARHTTMLQYLLQCGAHIDSADKSGVTLLVKAVTSGDKARVSYLLGNGANCNVKLRGGSTPFIIAARKSDTWFAEQLLAHGGDPHATTDCGFNALASAVAAGGRDMVEYLRSLDVGSSFPGDMSLPQINAKGVCCFEGLSEEEVMHKDAEGRTVLMHAARGGNISEIVINAYRRAGMLDAKCNKGITALGYAVVTSHALCVELLKAGAKAGEEMRCLVKGVAVPLLCGCVSMKSFCAKKCPAASSELLTRLSESGCRVTVAVLRQLLGTVGCKRCGVTDLLLEAEHKKASQDTFADLVLYLLDAEPVYCSLLYRLKSGGWFNFAKSTVGSRQNEKGETLVRILVNKGNTWPLQCHTGSSSFDVHKRAADGLTPLQATLLSERPELDFLVGRYSKHEAMSELHDLKRSHTVSQAAENLLLARFWRKRK